MSIQGFKKASKEKYANMTNRTLKNLWVKFKKARSRNEYHFPKEDPNFLTMLERESLIDTLFERIYKK